MPHLQLRNLIMQMAKKNRCGLSQQCLTLDELSTALSRKADEQGATSFKILSATGNNRLHGVAEIYK
jgi:hypothetical protein